MRREVKIGIFAVLMIGALWAGMAAWIAMRIGIAGVVAARLTHQATRTTTMVTWPPKRRSI